MSKNLKPQNTSEAQAQPDIADAEMDETDLDAVSGGESPMQQENRSYTAVSNIMKTKHDTVKNSISNIR